MLWRGYEIQEPSKVKETKGNGAQPQLNWQMRCD